MDSNKYGSNIVTRFRWSLLVALGSGGLTLVTASTASAQVDQALMTAAHAAVCGPERKNVVVAGHGFNIKRAIIVNNPTTGLPAQLSVTINHRLAWRPDDDVHCVVVYNGEGVPQPGDCQVDPGGFRDLFGIFGAAVNVLPAFGIPTTVQIPPTGLTVDLTKINFQAIANALITAFGSVAWQGSARAIVGSIGLAAITPGFCTPPPTPFCGDNACNSGTETCSSCSIDCGQCDPACASACGSQASSCHGSCGMNSSCHSSCDSQLASCMAQC
jgi:hypothetical protein